MQVMQNIIVCYICFYRAAELMTKTGQTVTLRVAKQGAVYHGLADLLSQPSPIMQRSAAMAPSPTRRSAGPGSNKMMPRPKSEDVSRFNESPTPPSGGPMMSNSRDFPGQQGMYGARSSPALSGMYFITLYINTCTWKYAV